MKIVESFFCSANAARDESHVAEWGEMPRRQVVEMMRAMRLIKSVYGCHVKQKDRDLIIYGSIDVRDCFLRNVELLTEFSLIFCVQLR